MTKRATLPAFLVFVAIGCGDDPAVGFVVPGPVCLDFCDKVVDECEAFQGPSAQCASTCQSDINSAFEESRSCGEALEAFYECVAALSCEDVEDWQLGEPEDAYPCKETVDAANVACT